MPPSKSGGNDIFKATLRRIYHNGRGNFFFRLNVFDFSFHEIVNYFILHGKMISHSNFFFDRYNLYIVPVVVY